MRKSVLKIYAFVLPFLLFALLGCSKTQTYAEMLQLEQESIDKFLEYGGRYTSDLPANNSDILVTPDRQLSNSVPFYQLENGVYMQVVDKGNGEVIKKNDIVYFRFLRINLNSWAASPGAINIFDPVSGGVGNFYYTDINDYFFTYAPVYTVSMSQYYTYGMGVQYPLPHLTNKSKAYLVIPSKLGFSDGVSSVIPYLYYIEYNLSRN